MHAIGEKGKLRLNAVHWPLVLLLTIAPSSTSAAYYISFSKGDKNPKPPPKIAGK